MTRKILLSIGPLTFRELLRQQLASQPKVEIIGESCNYIECLTSIAQHQPQLWIHSAPEGPDLKAAIDRAYELSPQLMVVRITPQEPGAYLQVRLESLDKLLAFVEPTSSELAYSA